tara:strand:+ start:2675 stop:3517 length:843 start_codon:yes stop_codon:yes gene_type:complete
MLAGEQFQSLCDIGLYTETNSIIEDQNKAINQNIHKISNISVEDIKKYNIIFVYTHFVHDFMHKFLDYLDNATIVTHNSDHSINDEHLQYLNHINIHKWFCQNRETLHPKLFSIPIGIANSQWSHGNQAAIKSIKENNTLKTNLVYKNFQVDTNHGERAACNHITNKNGILMNSNTSQEMYWDNIKKSLFVISPPGNGIDCHRIWECLYLQSVPVVKYHEAFSQFKHLPILFIDDWNQITVDFLRSKTENYINFDFNIPDLTLKYWKGKIGGNKNGKKHT